MSVLYIGDIALDRLYHQPESKYSLARDGTIRATEVYTARTASARRLAFAFAGRAHPEIPEIGVDTIDVDEQEGGLSRVVINYAGASFEGSFAAAGGETRTYKLRRATSQEPVETHPEFGALKADEVADAKRWAEYLRDGANRGKPFFPDDAPRWFRDMQARTLGGVFGEAEVIGQERLCFYYLTGVDSFHDAKVEFSETIVYNVNRPFVRNSKVGHIDKPPAKCPKYEGRNWRYQGSDEEQEGFAYRIINTWELSGPYGWDKFLYTRR